MDDTIDGCELSTCDCDDMLACIDDASIGLVIADPPYNIGFDGGK